MNHCRVRLPLQNVRRQLDDVSARYLVDRRRDQQRGIHAPMQRQLLRLAGPPVSGVPKCFYRKLPRVVLRPPNADVTAVGPVGQIETVMSGVVEQDQWAMSQT